MRFQPLPIYGGSYADSTLSWSAQDVLGYLPSQAESPGTKTEGMFKTPPGLRPFAEIPPTGGGEFPLIPSPPVRGATNAEGKLFVVIGTTMYQLLNTGIFQPIGTIPGTGPVVFSHNQIALGNQVLAVNGSAGYIYNTVTQVFERITDPGYPGAFMAAFIDGYFIQISANRRFAFNSDVANGLEYNTLDRFTSEFSPDLLVSLVASNNELFLLSETSGEFFENTGAAQQPFRSKRITMDRGCAGAYTVAKADNTVFWLGNNGYFYVLNGYAPQRISTRAIEQSILGLNWKQAFAFAWEDAGHTVIYWTFPDGLTWGYDTSTGLWHRRESYGLNRWRANTMTFWNQEWYAGDFQYGRIWKMDWNYTLEGDQEFPSERTTSVIHDNQNRIIIPRLELLMQVGQQETVPVPFPEQPPSPTISGAAPDGVRLLPYGSFSYTVGGGTGTLVVTRRTGSADIPGLDFDNGTWTGTPTTDFTVIGYVDYVQVIRVTDANGLWSEITDTIRITAALLGFATENYLFTGPPSNLVQSIPTVIAAPNARTLDISSNSLFLSVGKSSPFLLVKKRREDGTGYNDLPAFDDMPNGNVAGTEFSNDGQYLAVTFGVSTIFKLYVYKIDGDEFTLVAQAPNTSTVNGAPTWSPDGTRIAWPQSKAAPANGLAVYPFDPNTDTLGTPVYCVETASASTSLKFRWHPSGNFLAEEGDSGWAVYDARTNPIIILDTPVGSVPSSGRGAQWSKDGDYLYTVANVPTGGHRVAIYGFSGSSLSAAVYPASQPPAACNDSSVSADGAALAIGMGTVSPSVLVYEVLGSDLIPFVNQPTTTQSNTVCVAFTGSGLSE